MEQNTAVEIQFFITFCCSIILIYQYSDIFHIHCKQRILKCYTLSNCESFSNEVKWTATNWMARYQRWFELLSFIESEIALELAQYLSNKYQTSMKLIIRLHLVLEYVNVIMSSQPYILLWFSTTGLAQWTKDMY
jgi:hypothetical protein